MTPFEGLDLPRRLQNPLVQMGAQMLANSGPSLTPKPLFAGVPEAINRAVEMQVEQKRLDQEEKSKAELLKIMETQDPEAAALVRAGGLNAEQTLGYLMDRRRREEEWAREDARFEQQREWELADQTAARLVPDYITYEAANGDILRGNRNDPNGELSVWYDGADPAPEYPAGVEEYNFYVSQEQAAGREPLSFFDYEQSQKSNGLSITTTSDGTTTVTQGGAGQYGKTVDTGFGTMQNELQQGAMTAFNGLDTVDRMEQAMADPAFFSGAGSDQVMVAKQLAAAMGIDPDGVTSMEEFRALSAQSVMDMMGGSLGAGVSNADRSFVEAQAATLANSPEGNRSLLAIQRKLYQRQIEMAERAAQYEQAHGKLDVGFVRETAAWAAQNPLFASPNAQSVFSGSTGSGLGWSVEQ